MIETASTGEMVELFGISERSVREHASTGIFVRVGKGQYDVKASIRAYVTHMREAAAGRPATNEELRAEKIRLTAAQADMAEMAKAVKEGRMVDVAVFEERWAHDCTIFRQIMMGLPSALGMAIPHLSAHDLMAADRAVRDALTRCYEEIAGGKLRDAAGD